MTNNKPNDVLLPCPFCNGDAGVPNHADDCYFTLSAQLKESSASDLSLVPDVLRAWNRRAILAQPADQQGEPVAAMYEDGSVLTRADCIDDEVFAICCKAQTPLYRHAQPATAKVDERLTDATAFVQKLCDAASGQPSVATGYLSDILDVLQGRSKLNTPQ
ncbi:hypothetical protein [Pseudomonas viridiflava]|uniref:hypothetical protein n=1 Tax=Pseudomonas viridiflava TaxID=33069 RepID=UPI000F01091D|nr:hypothetical protein [Pseudomonas viridiflava]